MPEQNNTALTLLSAAAFRPSGEALEALKIHTLAQLQFLQHSERTNAARAVLIGLRLHLIKAGLPYGEFGSWIDKSIPLCRRQVGYYMRLAVVAIRTAKLGEKNLLSITSGQADTALAQEHPEPTADKIRKFVGECSITELLIKHNIKSVGLRSELTGAEDKNLPPERQLELAMERAWEESWNSIERVRGILGDTERAKLISDPQKLATLKEQIIDLQRIVDDRLAACRAIPA
jgi:hypothetical protein